MHALFLTPTCLLAYIAPVSNTHATRLLSLHGLSHYHFIAQYYRPIELITRDLGVLYLNLKYNLSSVWI